MCLYQFNKETKIQWGTVAKNFCTVVIVFLMQKIVKEHFIIKFKKSFLRREKLNHNLRPL